MNHITYEAFVDEMEKIAKLPSFLRGASATGVGSTFASARIAAHNAGQRAAKSMPGMLREKAINQGRRAAQMGGRGLP